MFQLLFLILQLALDLENEDIRYFQLLLELEQPAHLLLVRLRVLVVVSHTLKIGHHEGKKCPTNYHPDDHVNLFSDRLGRDVPKPNRGQRLQRPLHALQVLIERVLVLHADVVHPRLPAVPLVYFGLVR